MPEPVKPWESFEGQLALLKANGLLVGDEQQALNCLETIGYYRLSGYWYPLRSKLDRRKASRGAAERASTFVAGSQFEDVVRLYMFDKKLRLLALDALESIEMAVRVDVAYLLGERDALAHENPACLHAGFTNQAIKSGQSKRPSAHDVWMDKYQRLRDKARHMPFVAHHMGKYGTLPIWVAIELWDFGLLSTLFSGMQPADKDRTAVKYRVKDGATFEKWLHSLNFLRNVCAHHSRLWNIGIPKKAPPLQGRYRRVSNAQPFFYFCLMQHLMRVISPASDWHLRFKDLLRHDFPGGQFSLGDFGLLPGWAGWPLWRPPTIQKCSPPKRWGPQTDRTVQACGE